MTERDQSALQPAVALVRHLPSWPTLRSTCLSFICLAQRAKLLFISMTSLLLFENARQRFFKCGETHTTSEPSSTQHHTSTVNDRVLVQLQENKHQIASQHFRTDAQSLEKKRPQPRVRRTAQPSSSSVRASGWLDHRSYSGTLHNCWTTSLKLAAAVNTCPSTACAATPLHLYAGNARLLTLGLVLHIYL